MSGSAGPARRADADLEQRTAAWDLAKVLLIGCAAAALVAGWFALRPVENPGVQDCGAPLRFMATAQRNVEIPVGTPDAPPDAPRLRTQPPCSELVVDELQRAGLFTLAFVGLGLAGAALGLLDDRLVLRRAPRFETLLRERPAEAPSRPLDPVPTRPDDLGERLPPVEPAEVALLALGGGAGLVGVSALVGLDAVRSALGEAGLGAVVVLAGLAALTRAVAGTGRYAALGAERATWPDHLAVAVASSWASRVRPETGVAGVDVHHLVKVGGLDRRAASLRAEAYLAVALAVHVLVLAVLLGAGGLPAGGLPDERGAVLLAGAAGLAVVVGLSRAPRVVRAQAVLPTRAGLWVARSAPGRRPALAAAAASLGQLVVEVAMLGVAVAAVGGSLPLRAVALAWLVAAAVGVLSPLPAGVGLTEAALALLLWCWGLDGGQAVAAMVLFRLATTWVPLAPGWYATRHHL